MVNVIVVDDDMQVRELLSQMLKAHIEEVDNVYKAQDGKIALDIFRKNKVDIIITDIKMPVMDGITLCQKIREFNETVKLVLISAYVEFEYAQEALRYAVSDYIVKPIDREEFERLKKMVKALAQNKEKKLSFYLSLHKVDLRYKVKSALVENNINYLFELLDKLSVQSEGDVFLIREYSILMIDAIFDYIKEVGFSHIKESKRGAMAHLMNCDSSESCILYVGDMIANIMQFTPKLEYVYEAVKRVKRIIDSDQVDNQYLRMNVNELAHQHGLNRIQLSSTFKKEYGVPLSKYIVEVKMKRAAYLLRTTDATISKIATTLGYSDLTGFNKMFRKFYSMLPNEYRNSIEE